MNTLPHLHARLAISVSVLLTAACGTDDPAPDEGDAGTTAVTVLATSRYGDVGMPKAGVQAFATSPDGVSSPVVLTDAAGVAMLGDVPPGSSVTAIYDDPDHVVATTVVDVSPGETLRFGARDNTTGPEVGDMIIAFPPAPTSNGYVVYHGCGRAFLPAAATSATVRGFARCNVGTMDLLLISETPTSEVASWAVVEDVPFEPGTTYTYTGAWNPASTFDVALSGLAPAVTNVVVELGPRMNQGRRNMVWQRELAVSDGRAAASVPWAAAGDDVYAFFGVSLDDGASYGRVAIVPASTRSIELAPPAIPTIRDVTFDVDHRLRWTESGGGTYDVISWQLLWTAATTSGDRSYWWDVIMPRRDGGILSLPALPPPFTAPTAPHVLGAAFDWEDHDAAFVRSLPTFDVADPFANEEGLDDGPLNFSGFDD